MGTIPILHDLIRIIDCIHQVFVITAWHGVNAQGSKVSYYAVTASSAVLLVS